MKTLLIIVAALIALGTCKSVSHEDHKHALTKEIRKDQHDNKHDEDQGDLPDDKHGWQHGKPLPALCGCQPVDEPVCGKLPGGALRDFLNRCEAGCAYAEEITDGVCSSGEEGSGSGASDEGSGASEEGSGASSEGSGASEEGSGSSGEGPEASGEGSGASEEGSGVSGEGPEASGEGPGASEEGSGVSGEGPEASGEGSGASEEGSGVSEEGSGASAEQQLPDQDDEPELWFPDEEIPRLCGCPPIEEPVCGKKQDGSLTNYPNRCEAGCDFAEVVMELPCEVQIEPPIEHLLIELAPTEAAPEEAAPEEAAPEEAAPEEAAPEEAAPEETAPEEAAPEEAAPEEAAPEEADQSRK